MKPSRDDAVVKLPLASVIVAENALLSRAPVP